MKIFNLFLFILFFLQEIKTLDWKRILLHKAMVHVMCLSDAKSNQMEVTVTVHERIVKQQPIRIEEPVI